MTEQPSDTEIARGLQSGERWAFDALCAKYNQSLWRHVARLVGGDSEAVADVFQETMLAVARNGRSIHGESPWPWLARVAHRQAALYWRKAYRDKTCPFDAERLTANSDDPAELLEQLERADFVRKLLADMDPDDVTLLSAKYIDGLTVAQIVGLLGGTTESVRSKLARARRDFRNRYQRVSAQ